MTFFKLEKTNTKTCSFLHFIGSLVFGKEKEETINK